MKRSVFGILILLPFAFSCVKEVTRNELLQEPAILTQYEVGLDFSQFSTFALVDSISIISDNQSLQNRIATPNAQMVLNRIRTEMENRGFNESPVVNAELGINVSIIHELDFEVGTVVVPGYWWGYDGYWDAAYWGYAGDPFYYGYNYNYVYESGALLIELYDLKHAGTTNKLKVIWNAEIGDIYNTDIDLAEGLESVSQAFTQSPYLRH